MIILTILSFQGSWNELPHFIISRRSPQLNTLTSGVATLVSGELGSGSQFPLKMAAALLMTIPAALVFFVFQRYFVRGRERWCRQGVKPGLSYSCEPPRADAFGGISPPGPASRDQSAPL